jgi:alkanesulfonate monooxygenase SsuD/methylene tetrahydromethanopterin reductase-like flavin-dependent oxidoreductase (luciferase family)
MVGGSGPERTLPLVARFADVWSAQLLSPDGVRDRSAFLDGLLGEAGRHPGDVRRTLNAWVVCGRTNEELDDRLRGIRRFGPWQHLPLDQLLDKLREWSALIGTPEQIVTQIHAYEAAGIAELSVQWPDVDDVEGLEVLAREVLPHLATMS